MTRHIIIALLISFDKSILNENKESQKPDQNQTEIYLEIKLETNDLDLVFISCCYTLRSLGDDNE